MWVLGFKRIGPLLTVSGRKSRLSGHETENYLLTHSPVQTSTKRLIRRMLNPLIGKLTSTVCYSILLIALTTGTVKTARRVHTGVVTSGVNVTFVNIWKSLIILSYIFLPD